MDNKQNKTKQKQLKQIIGMSEVEWFREKEYREDKEAGCNFKHHLLDKFSQEVTFDLSYEHIEGVSPVVY